MGLGESKRGVEFQTFGLETVGLETLWVQKGL